jgi:hypothetical protein
MPCADTPEVALDLKTEQIDTSPSGNYRILQGFSKVHVGQLGSALTAICSELGIKFEKFQQALQVFQTSRCNCDANTFLPDVLMLWC